LHLIDLFSEMPTPIWIAVSGGLSAVFAWFVSVARINASIEQARIKLVSEVLSDETEQRAAFRATLIAEIAALRGLIKDCETEKEALHGRANRAEGQTIVLKASNEIMERWVTFFKERSSERDNLSICRPGNVPPSNVS
jgi:hypothetical protein